MDPNACWHRFLDHLVEEEKQEAHAALRDLDSWLRKGGFPPDGMTYNEACGLVKVLLWGITHLR